MALKWGFSSWRTTDYNTSKKKVGNTLVQDKDTIEYQADIEGYNLNNDSMPQLKNLDIRLKTMRVDNYITIEKITPQKQRKWAIQPSVGIGYGMIQQKPDIYVGISIGYKIF